MAKDHRVTVHGTTKNHGDVKGRDPLVIVNYSSEWDAHQFSFRPSDGPRIRKAIKAAEAYAKDARVRHNDPHAFRKLIRLKPTERSNGDS